VPLTTDDARPPYLQLADLIRSNIESGKYSPGEKLPTHRQLAEFHGVAPMTVQSAFRILRDEGLITSQQGRGSFVRSTVDQPRDQSVTQVDATTLGRIEAALERLEERVAALEERSGQQSSSR
jgi:GntR family transcriptional regulator